MGKGDYLGSGTVFGSGDLGWFGNSGVKAGKHPDADKVARRQANPLTPAAERRIGNLRVDIAGLEQQLARLDQERARLADQLAGARTDLNRLLHHHGLPLEPGKAAPAAGQTTSTKTTRNQRRKRARERFNNDK